MSEIESRNDWLYFIGSIIVNLFSAYLFYIGAITLNTLTFILIGCAVVMIIISVQSKSAELRENVDKLIFGQKKLNEKLKIHEQLIDIKADIKRLKDDKRK